MKKLLLLLGLVVIGTLLRDAVRYMSPMAQAYRSYRDEATERAFGSRQDPRFRSVKGHIMEVNYRLESAEREGPDLVRLVVTESVHFQRGSEVGPLGNRRIAQTQQRVLMRRIEDRWVVSELEEGPTEIEELGAIAIPAP